jgi:hypothetical protein
VRAARTDGEVRQLGVLKPRLRVPASARAVVPACPWPARDASGIRDTTPQLNTHNIESREIHYPWHPWFGRRVWIYRISLGRGPASARCGLEPTQCAKPLEVPLWMLEAASCSTLRLIEAPRVGCAVLLALRALLQNNMLQGRHHSVFLTGGADADSLESIPALATGTIPTSIRANTLATVAKRGPTKDDQPVGKAPARILEPPASSQRREGEQV